MKLNDTMFIEIHQAVLEKTSSQKLLLRNKDIDKYSILYSIKNICWEKEIVIIF